MVNLFLFMALSDNTLQETDSRMMAAALEQARIALSKDEVPIGAVVAVGGRIIATGYNMTETLGDPTAHAEMIALTAACGTIGGKYLNDCTLYVTVEPCPMCAAALGWAQLGRLVYGAEDPKRGYSLFRAVTANDGAFSATERGLLHPKTVVTSGLMADECSALMKDFFGSKR